MKSCFTSRELTLIALPVLLLALFAIGLSWREKIQSESDKRPRLIPTLVIFSAESLDNEPIATIVVRLFVDSATPKPRWWHSTATLWIQSAKFVRDDGRELPYKMLDYKDFFPDLDGQYEIRRQFGFPKYFDQAKHARFQATIGIIDKVLADGKPQFVKISAPINIKDCESEFVDLQNS